MTNKSLRILVVDDDEEDFVIVRDLLRSTAEMDYAATIASARELLAAGVYDLLLLDYRLGAESGLELLKEVRQHGLDAPVILLTGRGDEEVAVEALKAGASDYLVKSKLTESALSRAVTYAVQIHRDARLLQEAQARLRASEEKFRALVENICDTVIVLDEAGMVNYANARGALGYSETENVGRSGFELLHPEDLDRVHQLYLECVRSPGGVARAEFRVRHKDGSWRHVEATAANHLANPAIHGIIVSYHDITERKRAQQEVEDAKLKFETIVRFSPDPIAVMVCPEGRYVEVNDAFLSLYGYARDEVIGKTGLELGIRRDPSNCAMQFRQIEEQDCLLNAEITAWNRAGEPRIVSFSAGKIHFGQQSCMLAISHDVTERRKAEAALRFSDEIVRHAGALILACNGDGQISYASESITTLGFSRDDVLGDGWWRVAFDAPAEAQAARRRLAAIARNEAPLESAPYTRCIRRKDGARRHILWHDAKTPDGLVIGVGQDITALMEAESALKNLNEQLAMLLESLPVAVYRGDAKTLETLYISRQVFQITGFSADDFLGGQFWREHIHVDDLPIVDEAIRYLFEQGACSFEYRFRSADGAYHWLLDSSRLVRSADGSPEYVTGTWLQIDDRKLAEEALRLQSTALAAAANAIVITDGNGQVLWVNPAYTRMTGYSAEEIVGSIAQMFQPAESSADTRRELMETAVAGNVWQGEMQFRRKDGTSLVADVMVTPLKDRDGSISNFIGIKQDITEQRQLRDRLAQAQKMEAVGRLSGGVAHDFNNILGVILGYSELLAEKIPEFDPLHKQVEQIHRAGERAASLTRQLLAFSRQQVLQPSVLNLNAVVGEMEKMLHRLIGEDIEIGLVLASDLANIHADRSQLEQIIMNLAVNARDAMPMGGHLTIETANCQLDETYAQNHGSVEPGAYVMLAVTDTGVGMPKDVQSHVFEPFFTTKEAGKGTGLGLATVYGIVKQSGGNVWVYSEPGKGTTFKVYLPAKGVAVEPPGPEAPRCGGGHGRILLVEDSQPLRELTRDLLRSSGYEVLEAQDPKEALVVASAEEHIDLLVTDVVMPGMSGPQLAEALQSARPGLRVLYISGYTDHAVLKNWLLDRDAAFLQKPFSRQALCRKVHEVLNAVLAGSNAS